MENRKIAEEIIRQLQLFSLSGAYGVLLGIWYEFFRILRKTFVHKNRIVHLEDIIFCLTAAIGLFILFQVYNQGRIRFYCLFGVEGGVLLYFFVLSRWVGKVLSYLVGFFCRIIKIARGIFGFPGKVIVKNTGKTLKNMRKTIKIIRNHK